MEVSTGANLRSKHIPFEYETVKVPFTQPAKKRTYTPDFILLKNGIIIETKGRFTAKDREKHLWIQKQHPDLDIRFVFTNPNGKLYKGSPTSYAQWCKKHGFQYAKGVIPDEWIREGPREDRMKAVSELPRTKKGQQ
ncbi:hypothetical protein DSCO28_07900 [Desulfosarcina ovata subsp. sediminis]|uniref:Endonuclease I n=1 Tax=Desulfosarcina ovata subsp. sediminis TaxID=885957 RepID=A0A5K7ZFX6_9BACT|nr:hypothetical protein DSCO28_07900 [Desulfosarcina ovata subsp. sediminis]